MNVLSSVNKFLTKEFTLWVVFFSLGTLLTYAQSAYITGVVLDPNNTPLENVNITSTANGTTTDVNGYFLLEITADLKTTITFTHVGFENVVLKDLILNTNETFEFNPVMRSDAIQIAGVEVSATGDRNLEGVTTIDPEVVRKIPGANAGVENVLKLLPGVSFNNELSTQYNVRGGNFDENLVYVNGIEVYRTFLIRSAQQEGLSFVNSNMVTDLTFSAGGFQSKYGDRLSSVLDITYKTPQNFSFSAEGSFLGVGSTLEAISKNKKLTTVAGIRFRDNSLLVNSQQTNTNFNPSFFDFQNFSTYRFSNQVHLSFLGTYAINQYENEPLTRQTNFGTINEPRALLVFYEGLEKSRYENVLGALKLDYLPSNSTKLDITGSLYHTKEDEFSDIIASYELGEIETGLGSENLGGVTSSRGVGSQQSRARNQLDALIFSLKHSGAYQKMGNSLEWSLKFTHEDFRDQLRESEFIDSAGFFVRPREPQFENNQPEEPFTGDIVPFESVRATNAVQTNRWSGFVQFSRQTQWNTHDIYFNLGLRAQHWTLSGQGFNNNSQFLFSPRAQFSIKPNWERDILFRLAIGSYQQPPLYRELRNLSGQVNPEVEAQKSLHFVVGSEFSFELWNRPFSLVSEAYYKDMWDVNTYTIEDVRIRYAANNNAEAYAFGFDFRLTGTFVPGAESWVSVGYLQTEENIAGRGYISRPTDQRFKFAMLFQDYVPSIPNLKLYLNMVYNTGVPGGSPNNADPYDFQNRLRDYRRVDLGISYIFADNKSKYPEGHWLHKFKELSAGFEIFNMFNNQNSITNTWVRDVDTQQQFAVPNFLTSRVFNLKFALRF
nr:carboxypeptidase-like regulatory domain-containing protein [Allomuricauda hymeniacidonis]